VGLGEGRQRTLWPLPDGKHRSAGFQWRLITDSG
jgi:hypothetical protein